MNSDKQHLLLEYLISSPDTFALTRGIIRTNYFDPTLRKAVDFITTYYDEHNGLPSPDQIKAETSVKLEYKEITRDKVSYCSTEIEQFCKRKAIEQAIMDAPALIKDGDFGAVERLVRDAITVSLNKSLGVDYFANPLDRLEAMLSAPDRTTVGFGQEFDDAIGGGLARTEMLLLTANSGGGKSIVMANIALNYVNMGMNVLYVSLELSESMISQRFDQMLTGIPQFMWRENYSKIAEAITKNKKKAGHLCITRMPVGTNANNIRAFLKEYELKFGIIPDMIVVDYLDLMGPNEKVSADNISEKDKRAAEQLRDIGFDYNAYIVSASQQNRSAIDAPEINQSHIAGGITKINTVDISVSILLTPSMKAAGEIGFTFTKTRSSDGVGKTCYSTWDNRLLRVLPKKPSIAIDPIADRFASKKPPMGKASLSGPGGLSSLMDKYGS